MRVALVSSDGRCGIAEHSAMLKQYVSAADPLVEFVSDPAWLDPLKGPDPYGWDIVHLNYHRALHSRWTPEVLGQKFPATNAKRVVTFHDTYAVQPDRLPWDLLDVCDALIVHEPCDLTETVAGYDGAALPLYPKVYYWRQGVPELVPHRAYEVPLTLEYAHRPYVGTCGFAFPWKGFELLCEAAASVGWGVLILSHNATEAQRATWEALNPWLKLVDRYLSTDGLIAALMQCDATAFLYGAQNSGTSGAIRSA